MNDNLKTVIFVVVAVALLGVARLSMPSLEERGPEEMVGQPLVAEFDPLKANSLDILKYDENDAVVRPFSVAHAKGVWSIPSHDNYPADAKEHLADAAAGLLGSKILSVASQSPGDHADFGVLDPDPKDPKKGMGTRVVMKDAAGKELLALVIGKEVPGKPDLRYVRRAGQDAVYTAAVKTDKLSTKFEDWIEKDLLKLNAWDIKQIDIRDYSVNLLRKRVEQKGDMTLEYNDTGDPKWKLTRDVVLGPDGWKPVPLAPDEELNATKLDDMKYALDDLKIVDVRPKPPGLSADLKAEDSFVKNDEAVADLAGHGFFAAEMDNRIELFSNEGEFRVTMKDGVEYVLRFGSIAGKGSEEEAAKKEEKEKPEDGKKEEGKDGKKDDEKKGGGVNRFIFVTAQFNESAIPKPELEKLPEAKPAEPAKPDAAKPDAAKPDVTKPDAAKPDAKPAEAKPEEKKDLEEERKRIEKENQRKQDEHKEKVEQGKKKAKELNDRFAEWYYIISDETYRKIHLGRGDVVKKKEPEKKEGEKPGEKPGETPHDFEDLKGKVPAPKEPAPETPKPEMKPEAKPEAKPAETPKPEVKPEPKPAEPPKPETKPAEPPGPPPKP